MIRSNRVIQGMLLALSIGAAGIACGGGSDDSEKNDDGRDAPAGKRDAGKDDVDEADGVDDEGDADDAGRRVPDAGPTRDAGSADGVDIDVERGDAGTAPNDGVDGDGQTPPAVRRDGGTVASANSCNRSSCDQFITTVTAGSPDLQQIVKSCCVSAAACGYSIEAPGEPATPCMTQEQIAGMSGDDLPTSTAR